MGVKDGEDDGMNKCGSDVVATGVDGAVNVDDGIVDGTIGALIEGVEEVATDGVLDPGNLTKLGLGVEIVPGIGLLVKVPAFWFPFTVKKPFALLFAVCVGCGWEDEEAAPRGFIKFLIPPKTGETRLDAAFATVFAALLIMLPREKAILG